MLLAALIPAISFMGHWPLRVSIPGTEYVVGLPAASHLHGDTGTEDHSRHCHTSVATCSDTRVVADSSVAMLEAIVLALILSGMAHLCRVAATSRAVSHATSPELRPPRQLSAPA